VGYKDGLLIWRLDQATAQLDEAMKERQLREAAQLLEAS
jgi:hypothetical protein